MTMYGKYHVALVPASVLCLLVLCDWQVFAQAATAVASPLPTTACKDGVSPGVIQLTPDPASPNKLALARKHFYLSSSPFNLAGNGNLKTAPSLKDYYTRMGASPQLIAWLEDNSCETVYCRELTTDDVTCQGIEVKKCVPEFVSAYHNALANLNGNQEQARKWITNYEPLSSPKLRVGFFEAKRDWLKNALEAIEKKEGNGYRITTAISDKDGIAYFYDLCPGTYYISSIAPIEIQGTAIVWETPRAIKVEGPPDVNKAVVVTLAFPPGKDKKNFFVGKSLADMGQ